ncbi:MurR/RpiR family transcriptional regulator [Tetragenococcus halophilus]|uniref:MurR/RpiR family transcriptional regulator n=1 Tax=Tetragenococcus halophilus TaxID=51669 RepID=UPI00102F81B5|nr:MurR/RpiR family transcriptional regulator [Tetragenococcus halophilus]WJS82492.1 MurR/RpiR family transcriptional regulator [Tetragenococcus halophilus]GFK23746.1 RpiR family transcriptional regulator [Tetragenococcus halophilus]GMG61915.1 MurR/RpiR family transcriptional regulator GlvR [Tetragenococcus halophilus]GMQ73379.1 MurR/RpiR family transcriptional regulator GlvR [Tetragenococcus halophilus]
MLITEKMNRNFEQLNANERIILDQVIKNKKQFHNLTINEFAQKNLVSKSFVIRLCKKLGFSGYSEFKYQLKNELENTNTQQTTQTIMETTNDDLNETLRLINTEKINELTQLLSQAPHIYTYGTGYGQRTILEDFKRGLISGQRIVTSLPTSVELRLYSEIMEKNDILIVVSMRGRVENIKNTLILLREKGVNVISITHFITNELASIAPINLYLKTTAIFNPSSPDNPYVSYTPLCMLLDLIVKNYLNFIEK